MGNKLLRLLLLSSFIFTLFIFSNIYSSKVYAATCPNPDERQIKYNSAVGEVFVSCRPGSLGETCTTVQGGTGSWSPMGGECNIATSTCQFCNPGVVYDPPPNYCITSQWGRAIGCQCDANSNCSSMYCNDSHICANPPPPTSTPTTTPTPTITPTPKCPAAGSNDTKICRNNSLSHSYADGNCGTTTVAIECPGGCTTGSSSCNTPPTCPAAGTVLSQSCEGNNLTETYSTGNYELALGMCGKLSRVITCPSGCPAGGTACNPTPTPTPTTAPLPSTCDPDKSGASNHIITDLDFAWWKDEFLGTKTTKDSDCKQDNIIDIFDFNKMRDLRWPGLLH